MVYTYSEGIESIEDELRSRWLSTAKNNENIVRVLDLVWSERRLMVRTIGEQFELTCTAVYQILTNDLEVRKIGARSKLISFWTPKIFPCLLNRLIVRLKRLWLFHFSTIEYSPQRTTFWDTTEYSNVSE